MTICGQQYVGKTTEAMHLWLSGHKTEIWLRSTPFSRHFSHFGLKNISLQVIDSVIEGEDEALQIVEGMWQHKLATFEVHGNINRLNEMKKWEFFLLGDLPSQKPSKFGENQLYPTYKLKKHPCN